MIETFKKLLLRYKPILMYLIFGVLTTLVNWVVYFFLTRTGLTEMVAANILAWAISVLFAYITNKLWVFESRTAGLLPLCREFISFVGARVLSGVLDTLLMIVFVDGAHLNDGYAKVIVGVVVVVLNYVFSKLFVFKGKKNDKA